MWWVNGKASDQIPASDRGLAYGDGLFETMRVVDGDIPLLQAHLNRLHVGAERLDLCLSLDKIEQGITTALSWVAEQSFPQAVIKLIVTRSGQSAGYRTDETQPSNYFIRASELKVTDARLLRARICDYVLPASPALAGVKHLSRLDQVMASRELSEDDDEGLLLDARGCLVEGISNNIFVVTGTELAVPLLAESGVKGVMRDFVIAAATNISSLRVVQRDIPVAEIDTADELILTNAVRGVRNLSEVSGHWSAKRGSAKRGPAKSVDIGDMLRALLCEKLAPGFTSF